MQAFIRAHGIILPMNQDHVDTDAIIPQRWLVTVERDGLADGFMGAWRYDEHGQPRPECVLNQPAYQGAAIVLAREVMGGSPSLPPQPGLGLLDITVQRNAFGRQVDSFTAPLDIAGLDAPFPAVFIRAPVITRVGPAARALATLGDRTAHVQQGRVLASAFHPELTEDTRLHRVFLGLAGERAY